MNLSGSNNKHPLNPKILPNNSHSRIFEGIKTYSYKGNTVTTVDTCVKNRGSPVAFRSAPINLLLQGGTGFSQPSSELSSSEDVWMLKKMPRK